MPSLKQNYLYRVLYEVLILVTPVITTPYVSRVLGADGVGIYSYSYSVITYFMLFGALGTQSYGSREIARNRDNVSKSSKLFWEIELLTVLTTGICLVFWGLLIAFSDKYQRLLFLALTPFLIGTMLDVSWYFTGLEKVKNIVIRNSAVKITGILLLFVLVKSKDDVYLYCLINSVTNLLGNLSMWLYLPQMLTKVEFRSLRLSRHFKETVVYFIPTIATSVYTVLDKTLIGAITQDAYQNGYYEQATKIVNISKSFVFVALNSIMTARISYLFSEGQINEVKKRIEKSMDFIMLLGIGAMFGIIGISHRFVPVFFGKGFEPVEHLLYLMSPLIIIIGISNCLGNQYYIPSGKRGQSAKYIIVGSLINLLFNICLIPVWKADGAVCASIIAEVTITFLYVKNCCGIITPGYLFSAILKRVPAGVIMAVVVRLTGNLGGNNVLVIALQLISGVSLYATLLVITKDEMALEIAAIIINAIRRGGE